MEIKINFVDYKKETYKFIYVADVTGALWFAGKPIIEMLQNSSKNTDRSINRLDKNNIKKLENNHNFH